MALFDFHFDFGQWTIPLFRRKPKAVLVVEDDATTARLIEVSAEAAGFTVEITSSAEEALGILRRNGKRFVLVMVDVHLPGVGGWTLRKHILSNWPSLPVVVMSAAEESFRRMPTGERLSVMIKPTMYGDFFRDLT